MIAVITPDPLLPQDNVAGAASAHASSQIAKYDHRNAGVRVRTRGIHHGLIQTITDVPNDFTIARSSGSEGSNPDP